MDNKELKAALNDIILEDGTRHAVKLLIEVIGDVIEQGRDNLTSDTDGPESCIADLIESFEFDRKRLSRILDSFTEI
jgi:hypothetical protein